MRPGEVAVEGVSRRFVVRARDTHTLKELVVARGRTGAQEVWALRDVSLGIGFARIEMPNAAPEMIDALAGIARRELAAVAS